MSHTSSILRSSWPFFAFAFLAACSNSSDAGPTGSGASAGTTNGTSGSTSNTAGTPGTGTGGTGTGSGGAGTGTGGNGMGPFACGTLAANCDFITHFGATGPASWGTPAAFSGGVTVFGAGITRDATNLDSIHVSGMVAGYGHGFGLYFNLCSDLSAFTGVSFHISGTAGGNMLDFQVQTNSDFPYQLMPPTGKGSCPATDPANPFGSCIAPGFGVTLPATDAEILVPWASMTGGMPIAWSATASPKEVIGIQWQFRWMPPTVAYPVDVTLSDVKFIGGPGTECPVIGGGAGGAGAGGASGAGGAAGSAGAGGAAGGGAGAGGAGGSAGTVAAGGAGNGGGGTGGTD